MVAAPATYANKGDAQTWLTVQEADRARGTWQAPTKAGPRPSVPTLAEYAEQWLAGRVLRPKTRYGYERLLEGLILPRLGDKRLDQLDGPTLRRWHAEVAEGRPVRAGSAYLLLRAILKTAHEDGHIATLPPTLKVARAAKPKLEPATPTQIAKMAEALPQGYREMVLLAAWCGLRYGEVVALRARDIAPDGSVVSVTRAASFAANKGSVGPPKTAAGTRDVTVPPHLWERVAALRTDKKPDDLLFPPPKGSDKSEFLIPSTFGRWFARARTDAGWEGRFHDLRHSGAVLAALSGATIAELMERLGHESPRIAMRYQHVASGRARTVAERLSALADLDMLA